MLLHIAALFACPVGIVLGLFLTFGAPLMVMSEEQWNGFGKVVANLLTMAICVGLGQLCFMLFDWGTRH
ncbi:MAG: hypothetical protein HY077_17120 [Elusimicrobia bacterium]|nr:hypothetical protein [Elusimicrobiota bacterium]